MARSFSFFLVFLMFTAVGCFSSTGGGITPEELCGNGTLDEGEQCDGANLNAKTCITQGFASGTLACTAACRFDTTGCEAPPVEDCDDGVDNDGDGDIDCADADCASDPACQAGEDCGNGVLDTGEHCDGANLNGKTCQTQGFAGGTLACTAACRFDTTGCNPVEDCDNGVDDDRDGAIDCADADCASDPACQAGEDCGNGVINAGESCDGSNHGAQTCATLGFTGGGTLACNAICHFNTSGCRMSVSEICNNGIDDDGNGAIDCFDHACFTDPACLLPTCGDSIVEIANGEVCDRQNLNGHTCVSLGYAGGTLACNANCTLNTSGCSGTPAVCGNAVCETGETPETCPTDCGGGAICGNGVLNPGEQCDGSNLGSNTCVSLGYTRGTLVCTSVCTLNTSACTRCGNGVCEVGEDYSSCPADCPAPVLCGNGLINPGESCDGANLNSQTCATLGYTRGTLSCNSVCQFNTSACTRCGNGTCESGEDYNNCPADCPAPSVCGNGVINTGESCDGANLNSQTCVSQGFAGGTLACNTSCAFNTAGCYNSTGETICNDGLDNDGDGRIDAQDSDCGVFPSIEQNCTDGIDNDADGYTDCADWDCVGADVCRPVSQRGVNSYFVCLPGANTTEFGCVCSDDLTNWSGHHATGRVCMGNAKRNNAYEVAWSQGGCSPTEILRYMDLDGYRDFSAIRFMHVSNIAGSADNMVLYVGCSINPSTGVRSQANIMVAEDRYDPAQQAIRNQLFGNSWIQVEIGWEAEDALDFYATFYPR
jgi:hypothetical protein